MKQLLCAWMVLSIAAAAHAQIEKPDVHIAVGQGATVIVALEQGKVDVLSQTDPAMTILEREGKIKIIAETRTPEGTEKLFGGPMPAASLYAPVEFVKKNPNTVQALTNATVRALLWMQQASPQQILATVPEAYLLGNKE